MRPVNAYRERIADFPGRLFPLLDAEAEIEEIRSLLGRFSTVYCELGCGSGKHLIELAARERDALLLGFELRYKRAVRTIEKALAAGRENIYVLRADALAHLQRLGEGVLDGIFVHFPDPWDKKRWHKHRLLKAKMLESAFSVLKDSGFLSVKSDHRRYIYDFLEAVEHNQGFRLVGFTSDLARSPYGAQSIPSEFEHLFERLDKGIYYLRLERRARSDGLP